MSQKDSLERAIGRDVSRETLERLEVFSAAVAKWSPAINLVAPSNVPDLWSRHILDSAQIWRFLPQNAEKACDLGAGGGFPGLVLACLAAELQPELVYTLVESDARKAAFLTLVSGELGLTTRVIRARAETIDSLDADVLSARALAALPLLLGYCHRHLKPGGLCLLPKGRSWLQEVDAARLSWHFDLRSEPSLSDPESALLIVENLHPVEPAR